MVVGVACSTYVVTGSGERAEGVELKWRQFPLLNGPREALCTHLRRGLAKRCRGEERRQVEETEGLRSAYEGREHDNDRRMLGEGNEEV